MVPPASSRSPSLRSRLALGLVSLGVAVLLAEVLARQVFPAPPMPGRQPQIAYQSHPSVGYLFVPDQQGYIDDGVVTINELGLRGAVPEVPKPDGVFRVLAIGDSTTLGWGVHDDETYPAQFEARLRPPVAGAPVEVVNAGVSGYSTVDQARLLRLLFDDLEPDLVLIGFFWNDLPYHRQTLAGEALAQAPPRDPSAGPFRMGFQPSRISRLMRRSRLLYVARHALPAGSVGDPSQQNAVAWELAVLEGRESPVMDAAWQEVGDTLGSIASLVAERRVPLALVVMPIREQVEADVGRAYQRRVQRVAEAHGVRVIDPLPAFLAAPDREALFIPYDRVHFSSRGNELIAEAVAEALAESWGPPQR